MTFLSHASESLPCGFAHLVLAHPAPSGCVSSASHQELFCELNACPCLCLSPSQDTLPLVAYR